MLVSVKRLVLLLGLLLGSHPMAGAQGTEHHIASLQSPPLQMTVSSPRQAPPFGCSVQLIQQQGNFHGSYDFRAETNHEHQNPDSFALFQQSKTPFVTESRLRVAQIWGARLQVNLFVVTFHSGNIMLGPLVSSEAFHRADHSHTREGDGAVAEEIAVARRHDARIGYRRFGTRSSQNSCGDQRGNGRMARLYRVVVGARDLEQIGSANYGANNHRLDRRCDDSRTHRSGRACRH